MLMSRATHILQWGGYRGLQYRKVEPIPKTPLSWDCGLKFARMNLELVVIADQQAAVNTFSPLAHTARQISKVEGTQISTLRRNKVNSAMRVKS
jgi:hypothetical protein